MSLETIPTVTSDQAEAVTTPEVSQAEIQQDRPLTPEMEATLLGQKHDEYSSKIDKINNSQNTTKEKLNDLYAKLGISPKEEVIPSIQASEEEKQKIIADQEEVKNKLDTLLLEVKRKEEIQAEKKRLLNELLKEITLAISNKVNDEPLASFVQNFQWRSPVFMGKPPTEISEIIKRLSEFITDHGEITDEDLKKVPEIEKELEKDISTEAEKNVTNSLEEKNGTDIENTATIEVKNTNEIPIGYEGKSYTPNELLAHIENQNQTTESTSTEEAK